MLDAVVPLSYNLFTEPAFAQQRIGEKYLLGCEEQPRCAAAFPDLARRYLALVDRLNADPVTVQVAAFGSLEAQPVELTGDLLEDAVFTGLYMNAQDLVPLIIDRADGGDFTYVTSLLLPLLLFDNSVAEGMHLAVTCADRGDTDADFGGLPRHPAAAGRKHAGAGAGRRRDLPGLGHRAAAARRSATGDERDPDAAAVGRLRSDHAARLCSVDPAVSGERQARGVPRRVARAGGDQPLRERPDRGVSGSARGAARHGLRR